MKLSTILAGIEVQNQYSDVEIADIASNSKDVKPGMVFVCKKGLRTDGHLLAKEAWEKGAAAIVCEYDLSLQNQVIVQDTRSAYSIMCGNFFKNPSKKLKLIGVTGTNGKTTTTYIIKSALEYAGKKCGVIGTIQNIIGDEVYEAHLTTPDSYELQSLFAKMLEEGCEYAVLEASSHALDQCRLDGCFFKTAIFTNLTRDHLDYHGTMENYLKAKKKLFLMCEKGVVNFDDDYKDKLLEGLSCKIVTYSAKSNFADFTAKNIRYNALGVKYELVSQGLIGRVSFKTAGEPSVYNSMAAAVALFCEGLDFHEILHAISKTPAVKGRLERVETGRDFSVFIDYAHTPDGLLNVLKTVKHFARARVITVFGCGGDRDKTKRPIMGKIAGELSDLAVITSDNPRTEPPMEIIQDILKGITGKNNYIVIENREDAIKYAMENAERDDIIILAGKGHETYQILADRTIHFDEREVIKKFLQ